MKLRGKIPAVILGIPLAESENPFMSAPVGVVEAEISVEECGDAKLEISGPASSVHPLLKGFYESLASVLPRICTRITYQARGPQTRAGLYAALTTLLLHALARHHGDTLDEWEIVEFARNADPIEKPWGWGYVIDALRYTVSTGKIVVYRNDEEFAALAPIEKVTVVAGGEVGPVSQALTREDVGPDPYNATIHLVGVTVLEGAVRVQEGRPIPESLLPLARVVTGIAVTYWGLPHPGQNCIYSPGLPGYFDKICFSREG